MTSGSPSGSKPYGDSIFIVSQMKDEHGKEYKGVKEQFVKVGQSRGSIRKMR
jgi:membrane fusion protein (multidrug efflux system)